MPSYGEQLCEYQKIKVDAVKNIERLLKDTDGLREVSKNIEVNVDCNCNNPILFYDKKRRCVRCKYCGHDIIETDYFYNNDLPVDQENLLKAVDEKLSDLVDSQRLLDVTVKTDKQGDIFRENFYITAEDNIMLVDKITEIVTELGKVLFTNLWFSDNSFYLQLKEAATGITLDELKMLAYKIGLEIGNSINYITINEFHNKRY